MTEKRKPATDIFDIHAHILPGIDDGAKDWDMTLAMLRRAYDAGVRAVMATPHYLPWRSEEHAARMAAQIPGLCRETEARAAREHMDMRIYPGQELYWHRELPEAIAAGRALTLAGSRYVLVEFDEQTNFRTALEAANIMARAGYHMILAHFERYQCLREDTDERLQQLQAAGVQLQSNLGELRRPFWDETRRYLAQRYKNGQVRFIGSDMHNTKSRPPLDEKTVNSLSRYLSGEEARAVLGGNAWHIIEG